MREATLEGILKRARQRRLLQANHNALQNNWRMNEQQKEPGNCQALWLCFELNCFMRSFSFSFEDSFTDVRNHPAIQTVFTSVVACKQDNEAEEDVSWVVRYGSGKEETEVHYQSEEHGGSCQSSKEQPKTDQEFT